MLQLMHLNRECYDFSSVGLALARGICTRDDKPTW